MPRFVSSRNFIRLWLLLVLLVLISGVAAYLATVPVYTSGSAVAVDLGNGSRGDKGVTVVAFLPSEYLTGLRPGRRVILRGGSAEERSTGSVEAVEPNAVSPQTARKRFNLDEGAAAAVDEPSAAVLISPDVLPGAEATDHVGSVYRVDVEVGSRRVTSLLPAIGRFFGDSR